MTAAGTLVRTQTAFAESLSADSRLHVLWRPSDLEGADPRVFRETMAPVYEALFRLKRELPAETALIGFAGAPWTLATYMVEGGSSRDFADVKAWAQQPDFDSLIGVLTKAVAAHLIAQCNAGAEAVEVPAYHTVPVEPAPEDWAALDHGVDIVLELQGEPGTFQ